MFTLDTHSRTPIYEQLYKKVAELVMSGVLHPGDQLPSVRIMARELGVNPNTVAKAYQELERNGIICSVVGKGSFISSLEEVAAVIHKEMMEEYEALCLKCYKAGVKQEVLTAVLERIYSYKEERE